MKTTAASPDLERLNPFMGVWKTEGEMKTGSNETPARFKASDTMNGYRAATSYSIVLTPTL